MKNKFLIPSIISVALISVIVVTVILLAHNSNTKDNEAPNNTSSEISSVEIEIEDVVAEESIKNNSDKVNSFIEPDETEADKLLEEHKPVDKKPTTNKNEDQAIKDEKPSSFEESKKELQNTASDYLKKHNIDPKTAGETGDICIHCGKKIWNPDKYGLFIPGMPSDYENSGYCLGTCAITFG